MADTDLSIKRRPQNILPFGSKSRVGPNVFDSLSLAIFANEGGGRGLGPSNPSVRSASSFIDHRNVQTASNIEMIHCIGAYQPRSQGLFPGLGKDPGNEVGCLLIASPRFFYFIANNC